MKIILLQDVAKTGKKYDIKQVSDGYALNFLIPQKLAKIATKEEIKNVEIEKKKFIEKRENEEKELLKDIKKLSNSKINIMVKMNKEGRLFSGIGKKEIILAIKDQKAINLKEENIILEKPIKEAGEKEIEIKASGEKHKFFLTFVSENF